MARARNIKPSFFNNDELAELEPIDRLFFIGLWTIADYQGNFEWREKKLKAQLLPYDDCDVRKIAINLDKSRFIRFYSNGDKIYANITNFMKHQNPHKNEREKGSDIPDFEESTRQVIDFNTLTINRDKNRLNRNDSHTNRADSFNLIPDSCSLKPESLNTANQNAQSANDLLHKWFEQFWERYPRKLDKKRAKTIFEKIKPDEELFGKIMDGLNRQIYWRDNANGNMRPEWKHPTTWLNGENWNDDVTVERSTPRAMSKVSESNLAVVRDWQPKH